ncbi:GGDEF domain-containing protein [Brevibacillus dissolubilis]|uniref:GGDEF domain-containing protein n=1 Tax=Brevibacillus dissolubilis TaxID=1844116 RepID=UPI001117269C|nr:GGDEF domain-containing protein [Brevibacillus dissolubilis]
MRYCWIGLGTGILLAAIWWQVCGLGTESQIGHILVVLLTSLQALGGYWLGSHLERMKKMAYHDSLTGVLVNRRFFELMQQEVERARRNDYTVTLMVIDLDYFKQYNDCYGHVAGDRVLVKFAQLLRDNVRGQDLVGRWGGEEFVVLLPHTDTEQGLAVGNRIQHNVRRLMPEITVSIGLATFPSHATCADDLCQRADALMYEAKKKRDCMQSPIIETS